MFNCMDQNSLSITSPHKILVENQDNLLLPILRYLNADHSKQARLTCKCWRDVIQEMEVTQAICQELKQVLINYQPKKKKHQQTKEMIEKINSIYIENIVAGILSLEITNRKVPYYYCLYKKSLKQFKHILHVKDAFYSQTVKKIAKEIAFFHFPFQIIFNFGPGTESFRKKILDRYKNQTDQFKSFVKEFQIVNIFKNAKGGCIISANKAEGMTPIDIEKACTTNLSELNHVLNRHLFNCFDHTIVFLLSEDRQQLTGIDYDQTIADQLYQKICDESTEMKTYIDALPSNKLAVYKKIIFPFVFSEKFFAIWPEENANPDPNKNNGNFIFQSIPGS